MTRRPLKNLYFIPALLLLSGMSSITLAQDGGTAPKLDGQAQQVIDQLQALGPKPITELSPRWRASNPRQGMR